MIQEAERDEEGDVSERQQTRNANKDGDESTESEAPIYAFQECEKYI